MSKSKPRPIYLVGPMGVGKSTVGRLLAERLGREFADSDRHIESRAGRTIAEIFETSGEANFRRLEREAIETLSGADAVIALGGGALTLPGTLELLLESGVLVYLEAPVQVLLERIEDPSTRPLLAGLTEVERRRKLAEVFDARRRDYERATWTIDADGDVEQVVERILQTLQESAGAQENDGGTDD